MTRDTDATVGRTEGRTHRRVVVGADSTGRSAVVEDGPVLTRTRRENGALIEELWRQDELPAHGAPLTAEATGIAPPSPTGSVVRIYTLPPGPAPAVNLHGGDLLWVITVLEGQIRLALETEEIHLERRESVVLPGSVHDLLNDGTQPAVVVYTAFSLAAAGAPVR